MIVLIDDDHVCRLHPMKNALLAKFPDADIRLIETVPEAIRFINDHYEEITVISCDHDLGDSPFMNGVRFRPTLTGLDIAETVSKLPRSVPFFAHTSNPSPGHEVAGIAGGKYVARWGGEDWLQAWFKELEAFLEGLPH